MTNEQKKREAISVKVEWGPRNVLNVVFTGDKGERLSLDLRESPLEAMIRVFVRDATAITMSHVGAIGALLDGGANDLNRAGEIIDLLMQASGDFVSDAKRRELRSIVELKLKKLVDESSSEIKTLKK